MATKNTENAPEVPITLEASPVDASAPVSTGAAAEPGEAAAVGEAATVGEAAGAADATAQTTAPNWTPYEPEQTPVQGANPYYQPTPQQQPQQQAYNAASSAAAGYQAQQTPYQTYQPNAQVPPQQGYYPQNQVQPSIAHKDRIAAGLLGIFLGWLGLHKFYLGYNTPGFIMAAVAILGSIFTFGLAWAVMALIGFIEGIMYLIKSQAEFEQTYVFNKREWF
ncbi:MAG: TM2 domain-containing protein [Eggerthellaceae bacterium]|jgi:TM2 domain-containing membrane protein YozV|nr:TM2 domain-containing protein [Eggerthellaceae bacterium]MDR2721341.1 TM2 domain-containing protein [Coriobacteriaceae bacterium]